MMPLILMRKFLMEALKASKVEHPCSRIEGGVLLLSSLNGTYHRTFTAVCLSVSPPFSMGSSKIENWKMNI